jgi:hypothetical protein
VNNRHFFHLLLCVVGLFFIAAASLNTADTINEERNIQSRPGCVHPGLNMLFLKKAIPNFIVYNPKKPSAAATLK